MTRVYTPRMGRAFGFVTMLIVVAIGGYVYMRQAETVTPGGVTPNTTIDVTAVRNDLIAIGNAERRYWATNGRYVSLDKLARSGDIPIPTRPHYTYTAEVNETSFKIIARYNGPDPTAPRVITVDDTMAMTTN
jgi:hypothetical protein